MLMDKAKKTAPEALLVAFGSAKPKRASAPHKAQEDTEERPDEALEEETDSEPDWELMGSEVLDAIRSRDGAALAEAIRAIVLACED